jgi:hypothetical protein
VGPAWHHSHGSTRRPTNRGPTLQDEAVTATKRFPTWLWRDVVPLSGVTAIVGGAATMPVAIKIATPSVAATSGLIARRRRAAELFGCRLLLA